MKKQSNKEVKEIKAKKKLDKWEKEWYTELHKPIGIYSRMRLEEIGWGVHKAHKEYLLEKWS